MGTAIGAQVQVGFFANYPCPPLSLSLHRSGAWTEGPRPGAVDPGDNCAGGVAPETTTLAAEHRAVDEMARGTAG